VPKEKNCAKLGDLTRGQGGARHFDHRAELVFHSTPFSAITALAMASNSPCETFNFVDVAGQRDHDFRLHYEALALMLQAASKWRGLASSGCRGR